MPAFSQLVSSGYSNDSRRGGGRPRRFALYRQLCRGLAADQRRAESPPAVAARSLPNFNNPDRNDGGLLLKTHRDSDWAIVGLYDPDLSGNYCGWRSGYWDDDS